MSLQILVVIAAVFGIVIYRVITVSTFAAFGWALIRNNSQVATTGTAVCINFCMIMLLNVVSVKWYRKNDINPSLTQKIVYFFVKQYKVHTQFKVFPH